MQNPDLSKHVEARQETKPARLRVAAAPGQEGYRITSDVRIAPVGPVEKTVGSVITRIGPAFIRRQHKLCRCGNRGAQKDNDGDEWAPHRTLLNARLTSSTSGEFYFWVSS